MSGKIIRIFRVVVRTELHQEFEAKFSSISKPVVDAAEGSIDCSLGRPTEWAPDEYVMVSRWEGIGSLKKFAGDRWNEAFIPPGMEPYIESCTLHHYEQFDGPIASN
ncbi:MAG: antibiotic biosynthesis monooxygenase [Pseudomonadota bacterium]